MSQVLQGVVRGGRIELIDGPALADGQRVQVVIEPQPVGMEPAPAAPAPEEEEGVIHTPATPQLLALLEQIRRDRPPLPPSPTGPGRKSAAGMLADDPEFDAIMAEIARDRRSDYGREVSE